MGIHPKRLKCWLERFQASARFYAPRVFDPLDDKLHPKVFSIGWDQEGNSKPLCDFPEGCGYEAPDVANVPRVAAKIETEKRENNEESLRCKMESWKTALKRCVQDKEGSEGAKLFVSPPVEALGHIFLCLLRLDDVAWSSHESVAISDIKGPHSFLAGVVEGFLDRCFSELPAKLHDPKRQVVINPREVRRYGAVSFLSAVAAQSNNRCLLDAFYDILVDLSRMPYERAANRGAILFSPDEDDRVDCSVLFAEEVSLDRSEERETGGLKAIRKVLEMTSSGLSAVLSKGELIGLVQSEGICGEYFCIRFTELHTWEISRGDETLMLVEDGKPVLPRKELKGEGLGDRLKKVFPDAGDLNVSTLRGFCQEAAKQEKGTVVVISVDAEEEAERLKGQCTPVKQCDHRGLVDSMTAIDGAVLLDPTGTCHAIGVILDGTAEAGGGKAARGSRYNSTCNYVRTALQERKQKSMALIVSEDGHTDIIDYRDFADNKEDPE